MGVEYMNALEAEMGEQCQFHSESVLPEKSSSPPPAYGTGTAREPWTSFDHNSTPTKDDFPIDSPRRGKWAFRKRCLRACMHLVFAVTLFFFSAGFVLRAAYGKVNLSDQCPTPGSHSPPENLNPPDLSPPEHLNPPDLSPSKLLSTPENRRTIVHTTSNSIIGDYRLLDLLDLGTTSGTIDIRVHPEFHGKDTPAQAAAEFVATTMSGGIRANFENPFYGRILQNFGPSTRIPSRKHFTRVSSTSGSVVGTYLMGSTTEFKTTSGSMDLALTPAAYGTDPPSLVTKSDSGSQKIVILESEDRTALQTLKINSDSVSGDVIVRCSSDFEGTIEAGSLAGTIFVTGPGVKIIKNIPHPGGKYVEATKGSGAARIVIHTVSGDVRVIFAQMGLAAS